MRQFLHGAFDLAPGIVEVRRTHQRGGTGQPPSGTVGDGPHQIQIPQQFIGDRRLGLDPFGSF